MSILRFRLAAALALLALTGCATVSDFADRHPVATMVIVWSAATTAAVVVQRHQDSPTAHQVTTQPVTCKGTSCK